MVYLRRLASETKSPNDTLQLFPGDQSFVILLCLKSGDFKCRAKVLPGEGYIYHN